MLEETNVSLNRKLTINDKKDKRNLNGKKYIKHKVLIENLHPHREFWI